MCRDQFFKAWTLKRRFYLTYSLSSYFEMVAVKCQLPCWVYLSGIMGPRLWVQILGDLGMEFLCIQIYVFLHHFLFPWTCDFFVVVRSKIFFLFQLMFHCVFCIILKFLILSMFVSINLLFVFWYSWIFVL